MREFLTLFSYRNGSREVQPLFRGWRAMGLFNPDISCRAIVVVPSPTEVVWLNFFGNMFISQISSIVFQNPKRGIES